MYIQMATVVEWDPNKDEANRAKHGISFNVAAKVFVDPFAITRKERIVEGELRWQTIGYVERILLVAHTVRLEGIDEVIRIISARAATASERRIYEEEGEDD